MPQYYFHLYDDITTIDDEGADLPDLDAAREYAIATIRGLICGDVHNGRLDLSYRIEVADEDEQPQFTIRYGEAIDLRA